MAENKKRSTILVVAFVLVFIAGLILGLLIGMHVGRKPSEECSETASENEIYECRSLIYVGDKNINLDSITSQDASTQVSSKTQLLTSILKSEYIRDVIEEQYPYATYSLAVESCESIEIYAIEARSESPENLAEICNLATDTLCTSSDYRGDDVRIFVVQYAVQPTEPIED